MSNVSKGADLERRTCAWLKSQGYMAERVSRRGKYGTADLFTVADIVCINPNGQVELVQVTTKGGASARRKKIREANIPAPVRLFAWFKHNGRWNFISEEIGPSYETPLVD